MAQLFRYILLSQDKLMDSFGVRLKQEREKRKISLDDVSAATKISSRFLAAIESGRFDQLPGGIFNRGFIRAYARHLGFDEEQIVAEYRLAAGEDDPNVPVETDLPQATQPDVRSGRSDLPWKKLAALLLLLAVGLSLWKFRSREVARKNAEPGMKVGLPVAENGTPVGAGTNPARGQIVPASVGKPPSPHAANPNSQPFQLRIIAREDSWISVSGPDGEILHQVLRPPEEKSFHSASRIVVKIGNAAGAQFMWNGHELPVQGREGEVKTLVFDASGVHEPPPIPTP
jgi:cytoskeleton protein RodZ